MPTIYGYIRCSHEESAASGLGLQAQRTAITRYIDYIRQTDPLMEGVEMGEFFVDEVQSAFKKRLIDRPRGEELSLTLLSGDHVVFARIDRGFRNTRDFLDTMEVWQSREIGAHFADVNLNFTTAMGRLLLTQLAMFAELESSWRSERTRAALAEKRARGEVGARHVPAGYKRVRRSGRHVLVEDPKAREAMRLVVRLRQIGLPWSVIVQEVERHFARVERRRPTPDNPRWKRTTCQRAYARELEMQQEEEQQQQQQQQQRCYTLVRP